MRTNINIGSGSVTVSIEKGHSYPPADVTKPDPVLDMVMARAGIKAISDLGDRGVTLQIDQTKVDQDKIRSSLSIAVVKNAYSMYRHAELNFTTMDGVDVRVKPET